jgi:hypothetical protein
MFQYGKFDNLGRKIFLFINVDSSVAYPTIWRCDVSCGDAHENGQISVHCTIFRDKRRTFLTVHINSNNYGNDMTATGKISTRKLKHEGVRVRLKGFFLVPKSHQHARA